MNEEFLNKKIGEQEPESLKPAKVQVQGVRLIDKKKKDSEELAGQLITLICKHPDKDENIELSNAKVLINEKVKMSALWYNTEKDTGLLTKRSAAALLLNHYNVPTYGELVGKEVETTTQSKENNYLCIKAY